MTDIDQLIATLRGYANDPMWADHAEIPKSLLQETVRALVVGARFPTGNARISLAREATENAVIGVTIHALVKTEQVPGLPQPLRRYAEHSLSRAAKT